MSDFVKWFFDGLGTMLLGLIIGGGAIGSVWFIKSKKVVKQKQKAGDNASQHQVGGDIRK